MAIYLINRLPIPLLKWKSPYETLYKKPPDYEMLRIFGCFVYITDVHPLKRKFDFRARKVVFLGYDTGQKGYRFYNLDTLKVEVAKDVVFHKNIFPYFNGSLCKIDTVPLPLIYI